MRLHTHEQLLAALDEVVARGSRGDRSAPAAAGFWTDLLTRADHPLATDLPDENLLDWHDRGLLGDLRGKRVLDVGCGRSRNTRWFADHGALVDGIDIARELLDRSRPAIPSPATLTVCDILREKPPHGAYDVVYDSGCFHHLAPHRRETYLNRVLPLIAPAGVFGIVTLAADKIDSPQDIDTLVSGDVGGGTDTRPKTSWTSSASWSRSRPEPSGPTCQAPSAQTSSTPHSSATPRRRNGRSSDGPAAGWRSECRSSTGDFARAGDARTRRHAQYSLCRRWTSAMIDDMREIEVVVAHSERVTLRVGDVFLKIDTDQTRIDREVEVMARAPIPTPEVLWRTPPVLALAAVPGAALGVLDEPSRASSAAWVAAGAAIRRLHDAPLPPWPSSQCQQQPALGGRGTVEFPPLLDSECEWLVANDVVSVDVVERNRQIAQAALRPWTPVFIHGDLQIVHVLVDSDEVSGILDWSEGGQGDAMYDLATLTLAHEEHLDDVLGGYGGAVDINVIRAYWSLRSLMATRWLAEHGYGAPATFPEVAVLNSLAAKS